MIVFQKFLLHCHFSFSGLKTALANKFKQLGGDKLAPINDLAASLQAAIADCLADRSNRAMEKFRNDYCSVTTHISPVLVIAGGVAANKSIRENLTKLSKEMDFKTIYPDLKFCGDNAAMIAWAGIKRFKKNLIDKIDIPAKSRWPLDSNAPYMKGPGLKLD